MHTEAPRHTLSVSRLLALAGEVLEDNFVEVWVEGELSNTSAAASGHLYLTLKDARAQIRGVMFRMHARMVPFTPEDGMQVCCFGRLNLYAPRGDLQLVVERMEPVGAGSLQIAFEQLKARLAAEGLFDTSRKRELPLFPRTIGVVTSPTGAAVQDIIRVFRTRQAPVDILLAPARVQGEGAAAEIVAGIELLNRTPGVDLIIAGRGGGSIEDLWAFNEETVARAIAASRLPVISAVGHETDWTIADLAADLRAPTPSAAAETACRSRNDLEQDLDHAWMNLRRHLGGRVVIERERLERLNGTLQFSASRRLQTGRGELDRLQSRAADAVGRMVQGGRRQLERLGGQLDSLSPLKTLERGYALVTHDDDVLVRRTGDVRAGEKVLIRLQDGSFAAKVEPS